MKQKVTARKEEARTTVILTPKLDKDFRMYAVDRNTTKSEIIRDFIIDLLEKAKKKKAV